MRSTNALMNLLRFTSNRFLFATESIQKVKDNLPW